MAGRPAAGMPVSPPGGEHGLVVVRAREIVNPILAGHEGREYTSPPQPREQALALVAVLLRYGGARRRHQRRRVELRGRRRPARDHARGRDRWPAELNAPSVAERSTWQ